MGYYVYILLCNDGSFYTGYSKNVDERARLHAIGKGARYTKAHPPEKVLHIEEFATRSAAMKRERAIKKLSHEQKNQLINAGKPVKPGSKEYLGRFIVEVAQIEDVDEILAVQKQAFNEEAKRYNDFQIPPLVETVDDLKSRFQTHLFLKATANGKIIGSVRVFEKADSCYIGRLVVSPSYQNRGIGTKLLRTAETMFPSCNRFELFTGDNSSKNLHLYKKLGYKRFKVEKIDDDFGFVFLEKKKPLGPPTNGKDKQPLKVENLKSQSLTQKSERTCQNKS